MLQDPRMGEWVTCTLPKEAERIHHRKTLTKTSYWRKGERTERKLKSLEREAMDKTWVQDSWEPWKVLGFGEKGLYWEREMGQHPKGTSEGEGMQLTSMLGKPVHLQTSTSSPLMQPIDAVPGGDQC